MVTAERPHGEAEAINETRTADNLLQVLPAEVITSLPNANVADAIGRFPSVTLYRIEGEGVYIQVRGTEPRLTNITVDGITIPAPEPSVRQVRLDVIPSDMVDSVEMNKTLSANMDGNGIGGSVNLRTKEAGDQPTVNLYGNGGYTNIMNGRGSYAFGGTAGQRFGADKRFGLLGNAVFDYNGRGIDNIQPALDPLSTFAMPFYDSNTIREYRYYRTRYGFDGSADYRVNDNTGIYAHGFYSDLKDWGDKWYYAPSICCNYRHCGQSGPAEPGDHKVVGTEVLYLQQAPQCLGRHDHPGRTHGASGLAVHLSGVGIALLRGRFGGQSQGGLLAGLGRRLIATIFPRRRPISIIRTLPTAITRTHRRC